MHNMVITTEAEQGMKVQIEMQMKMETSWIRILCDQTLQIPWSVQEQTHLILRDMHHQTLTEEGEGDPRLNHSI